jgi:hypothetical protein
MLVVGDVDLDTPNIEAVSAILMSLPCAIVPSSKYAEHGTDHRHGFGFGRGGLDRVPA